MISLKNNKKKIYIIIQLQFLIHGGDASIATQKSLIGLSGTHTAIGKNKKVKKKFQSHTSKGGPHR